MDIVKLVASGMILTSSAWVGLQAALRLRRTEEQLRLLRAALERFAGQMQYSGTPFVPLCEQTAKAVRGSVGTFFSLLGQEAALPDRAPIGRTRRAAEEAGLVLPDSALAALERLFDDFGQTDLDSQVSQLRLTTEEIIRLSDELRVQMKGKCRSYALLGLTTGAAVLVLVL